MHAKHEPGEVSPQALLPRWQARQPPLQLLLRCLAQPQLRFQTRLLQLHSVCVRLQPCCLPSTPLPWHWPTSRQQLWRLGLQRFLVLPAQLLFLAARVLWTQLP